MNERFREHVDALAKGLLQGLPADNDMGGFFRGLGISEESADVLPAKADLYRNFTGLIAEGVGEVADSLGMKLARIVYPYAGFDISTPLLMADRLGIPKVVMVGRPLVGPGGFAYQGSMQDFLAEYEGRISSGMSSGGEGQMSIYGAEMFIVQENPNALRDHLLTLSSRVQVNDDGWIEDVVMPSGNHIQLQYIYKLIERGEPFVWLPPLGESSANLFLHKGAVGWGDIPKHIEGIGATLCLGDTRIVRSYYGDMLSLGGVKEGSSEVVATGADIRQIVEAYALGGPHLAYASRPSDVMIYTDQTLSNPGAES